MPETSQETWSPGDVPIRPAATVMMVRDGEPTAHGPLEVLMVRRNLNSDFVGGAYVFPGGGVDLADGGPEVEPYCPGRSDAEASFVLGIDSGGLAYWVAALRECFEEAGLLLAYRRGPDGKPSLVSFADPLDEVSFARARTQINAGQRRFLDVCAEQALRLAVDQVHYFAHWITPLGSPRRYDTRFFVAPAPPNQTPSHDAGETVDEVWVTPREALRRSREGQFDLIFPTICNLQAISRFATSAELLTAAAAASGQVPVVEPRVVAEGNGVRILLPGDPGYEASADAPVAPVADQAILNEAIRELSLTANRAVEGDDDPR